MLLHRYHINGHCCSNPVHSMSHVGSKLKGCENHPPLIPTGFPMTLIDELLNELGAPIIDNNSDNGFSHIESNDGL